MKIYPVNMSVTPKVEAFFDANTNTISYLILDPDSNACALIDSVLDFDYATAKITHQHADKIIAYIEAHKLSLEWIIETHVHADHLSAAAYIQSKIGGKTTIGENISLVQETFAQVFNDGAEFNRDGSQFDQLLSDGETYQIGKLKAFAMHTPGHTPACMVHVIGNAAFVGDTVFMPDSGSARADFPGANAGQLYSSIQKILSLPDDMRLFVCHDYAPNGREINWETTVAQEKANNIHLGPNKTKQDFIDRRTSIDKDLDAPRLILPALQVNMRAGKIPTDADGKPMLRLPVNQL